MTFRPLISTLNADGQYNYLAADLVQDFVVIGGGIVGLAIAQRLCATYTKQSVTLLERHDLPGQENSSRNSEVIHSGIYYPADSRKMELCLRGRDLMYDYCEKHNVNFRRTGKLLVALEEQRPYIEALHTKASSLHWPKHTPPKSPNQKVLPTELISGDRARELEPNLSLRIAAALLSPTAGIVDSTALMKSLSSEISAAQHGTIRFGTRVVRLDRFQNDASEEHGWIVQVEDLDGKRSSILGKTLINAAGLSSALILNATLPEKDRIAMYYAKGCYVAYNGDGLGEMTHLIYPCPDLETDNSFQSLGTHLTMDLRGGLKFGPDLSWIQPPESENEISIDADFWMQHLKPDESKVAEMYQAITAYLPNVQQDGLKASYVGIRPKLVPPDGGFMDFQFRTDYARGNQGVMISLLGIESPGLTSSLAIAELVVEDMIMQQGQNLVDR